MQMCLQKAFPNLYLSHCMDRSCYPAPTTTVCPKYFQMLLAIYTINERVNGFPGQIHPVSLLLLEPSHITLFFTFSSLSDAFFPFFRLKHQDPSLRFTPLVLFVCFCSFCFSSPILHFINLDKFDKFSKP